MMQGRKEVALVMDSFINGLGVIRGLKDEVYISIWLISRKGGVAADSKYVDRVFYADSQVEIRNVLTEINELNVSVIPFACGDENYRLLCKLGSDLCNFYIPSVSLQLLDKYYQIQLAIDAGVPVPESIKINSDLDLSQIDKLSPPYVVKPLELPDVSRAERKSLFKVQICEDKSSVIKLVIRALKLNVPCLVSEYIYGGEENLITYGGAADSGEVVTKYVGRKLLHAYPSRVAAIAETADISKVVDYGERYLKESMFSGMFQLELKYCDRRKDYFLIELNTRNWLWGALPIAEGINHALAHYHVAMQRPFKTENLCDTHCFVWGMGVLSNCVGYRTARPLFLLAKLMLTRKIVFAILSYRDFKPFLRSLYNLALYVLGFRNRIG